MEIINRFTRGTDLWGALEHLRNYKTLTVRTLSIPPFNSNAPNKIIQRLKEHFEMSSDKICLTFEWKINPDTKRRYKEFFLREV